MNSSLKKVLFLYDQVKIGNSDVDIHSKINKLGIKSGIYFTNLENLHNYLAGYRSFLISWLPEENNDWKKHCLRTIERIEKCLIDIN